MKPRVSSTPPEGLLFEPDFVTADEERTLLEAADGLEYGRTVRMGQPSLREVAHFGWHYDAEEFRLTEGTPIPEFLQPLRARAAAFGGIAVEELVEALITRYPPGSGIGWHRDAPQFGPLVVGVSLAGSCRMRFQRNTPEGREVFVQELPPRSAYVLGGKARSEWQHSIPAVKERRYSITFRTLRKKRAHASAHEPSPAPPG